VVKVNTDVDPAVGAQHNVGSIPTLAVFYGGRRTSGAWPAAKARRSGPPPQP
jgi:thioredoxin-like negative regulator of GroEL